jgi:hypothetical protein
MKGKVGKLMIGDKVAHPITRWSVQDDQSREYQVIVRVKLNNEQIKIMNEMQTRGEPVRFTLQHGEVSIPGEQGE